MAKVDVALIIHTECAWLKLIVEYIHRIEIVVGLSVECY